MYNVIRGGRDSFNPPFTSYSTPYPHGPPRAISASLFIRPHVCSSSSLSDELRLGVRGEPWGRGVGGWAWGLENVLKGVSLLRLIFQKHNPPSQHPQATERENGNRLLFGTGCMTHEATMAKIKRKKKRCRPPTFSLFVQRYANKYLLCSGFESNHCSINLLQQISAT